MGTTGRMLGSWLEVLDEALSSWLSTSYTFMEYMQYLVYVLTNIYTQTVSSRQHLHMHGAGACESVQRAAQGPIHEQSTQH